MQDGIYHVRFSSSVGGSGEGLVVIKQAAVNGGDPGYLYTGQLSLTGENISGRLKIKRWNPGGPQSVFGPIENFELQLSGKAAAGNSFTVSGNVASKPGLTITIAGRFLSSAA